VVRFGFLWANHGNDLSVGNFAVRRDLVHLDEKDVFGSGRHAGAHTLGEASKFVGKGFGPGWGRRSLQEVMVLLDLAGDGVDDHIGLMDLGE
jgi:hypothetical protein